MSDLVTNVRGAIQNYDASYLAEFVQTDDSTKSMEAYTIVPRLKLIQAMSKPELKKEFGMGTAVIRPGDLVLAKHGQSFSMTPVFFFVEFCKWSDRRDDTRPAIVERSFSEKSKTAMLALDPEKRFELYPGENPSADKPKQFRYVAHLNFICLVNDPAHPAHLQPFSMTFCKGEYQVGKQFVSAIQMRKIDLEMPDPQDASKTVKARRVLPLWAQVWKLTPTDRAVKDLQWIGLDFAPGDQPAISKDQVEVCRGEYEKLKELHAKQLLMVNTEHEEDETTPPTTSQGDPIPEGTDGKF